MTAQTNYVRSSVDLTSTFLLQLKARFSLVRELVDFMTPLYNVAKNNSSDINRYYVAIPTDECIQDFIIAPMGSSDYTQNRVVQAAVRSHIFNGKCDTHLESLGGHSVSVTIADVPTAGDCDEETEVVHGHVTLRSAQGGIHEANILEIHRTPAHPHFVFLVVDDNLHQPTGMDRRSVMSLRHSSLGGGSSQPLWQRIPCTAAKKVRRVVRENAPLVALDELAQCYKTDENSFRHFVVAFATEKETEKIFEEKQVSESANFAASDASSSSCSATMRSPSAKFHLGEKSSLVHTSIDKAMMRADTECTMFLSSYCLMRGFEDLIVSKVMQIVETATEMAIELEPADEVNDSVADDCGVALAASPSTVGSTQNNETFWSEEDGDQLVVAFHTIIGGALAAKILPHWEMNGQNEDFAFHHACNKLQRLSTLDEIVPDMPELQPKHFLQAAELVKLLNVRTLSVFSLMRVMESAINCVVDVVQAVVSNPADITADICIPLVVYVLICSSPQYLPSRIKFILDFAVPLLEMSSLGYAVTTFEAAAAQVLEEYRLRVVMRRE